MNKLILVAITAVTLAVFIVLLSLPTSAQPSLQVFSAAELARFNGTDPRLPIYLALDSYVYDVSSGREYYAPKGPYHDLAGKDSSELLHDFGGAIITRKYPVVGILN